MNITFKKKPNYPKTRNFTHGTFGHRSTTHRCIICKDSPCQGCRKDMVKITCSFCSFSSVTWNKNDSWCQPGAKSPSGLLFTLYVVVDGQIDVAFVAETHVWSLLVLPYNMVVRFQEQALQVNTHRLCDPFRLSLERPVMWFYCHHKWKDHPEWEHGNATPLEEHVGWASSEPQTSHVQVDE